MLISFIFLSVGLAEVLQSFKETFNDMFSLPGLVIDLLAKNLVNMVDIVENRVIACLFGLKIKIIVM